MPQDDTNYHNWLFETTLNKPRLIISDTEYANGGKQDIVGKLVTRGTPIMVQTGNDGFCIRYNNIGRNYKTNNCLCVEVIIIIKSRKIVVAE
jgi:hypothetical protein